MIRAVLLVLAAGFLAGCLGGDTAAHAGGLEPDGPLPDLFGFAMDERGEAVEGALVTVAALDLTTTTDEEGAFAFQDIGFEGRIQVQATKEGHAGSRAQVVMAPGLAARVVFTLPSLDSVQSMQTFYDFNGFLPCNLMAPGIGAQDCPEPVGGPSRDSFRIPLDLHPGEQVQSLEIAMDWDATSIGTETLHILVTLDDGQVLMDQVGPSPLTLLLDGEDAQRAQDEGILRIQVGLDPDMASVAVAQRFNGLMTQSTLLVA